MDDVKTDHAIWEISDDEGDVEGYLEYLYFASLDEDGLPPYPTKPAPEDR